MFQWKENVHTSDDRTTYTYDKIWSATPIESSNFHESDKKNPSNTWPFKSETQSAQNVTIGKFRLAPAMVERLGEKTIPMEWEDEGANAISSTADAMAENGFAPLQLRGQYFVSTTEDNDDTQEHVGQMRIKFHSNECDTATIIAQ